ncbi:hypothetical protein [Planococcus salinus]|uniref:Uncharacterized protein n=1 Tax=Planococcus salinus TaxID=1848460 RepID=A0A3M8P6S1_9BACL|nr:hypothetical protein [Planococcus salinus]RNF38970.1 hypothetical protein EEX84_11285 [Planococcus salinus]
MYIHPSFSTDGSFTLLQPLYTTLLVVSVLLFVLIFLPITRRKFINGFTVVALSLLMMWISIQLIYFDAIIVDEIGLGGNPITFFMVAAIVVFGFANPLFYFTRKAKPKSTPKRSSYR